MKIYVAGPMRGIPEFNFPAFHVAAAKLRAEGHLVFNPAERDIQHHDGFNLREALKDDLEFICLHADAVAVLPGWESSKGAQAEVATAKALGLAIIELEQA